MGSRRAQEKRRERLLALGVAEDELARIAAPIGLDLGGLTAEETALSIMAEVVAVRNGREGGRLSARGRRAHPRSRDVIPWSPASCWRRARARASAGASSWRRSTGGRCSSTRCAAMARAPVADRSWSCWARDAEEMRRGVDLHGAEVVVCPDWVEGQSASLRAGVDAVAGGADAVVVTLGDQPWIARAAIAAVVAARARRRRCRARDLRRHARPPGAARALAVPGARELRGDVGAREVLRDARVTDVPCDGLGDPRDVDTPADLLDAGTRRSRAGRRAAPPQHVGSPRRARTPSPSSAAAQPKIFASVWVSSSTITAMPITGIAVGARK